MAAGAAAFALVVASFVWRLTARGAVDTVQLVDRRAEIGALLEERARLAANAEGGGPPIPKAYTVPWRFDPRGEPPPLLRGELDLTTVRLFFPLAGYAKQYNPSYYFALQPSRTIVLSWPEHPSGRYPRTTNSLGYREDREFLEQRPDLRVIVTGDSHTDGVCANAESYPNRLEAALASDSPAKSVEVLNMGVGGYSFWNYLGTLEWWAERLEPHVFVAGAYGGNDFWELLLLDRYFRKRKPPKEHRLSKELLDAKDTGLLSQELLQVGYLLSNPDEVGFAIEVGCALLREMKRVADRHGIRFIYLYIPPPSRVQSDKIRAELDRLLPLTDWREEDLAISDRIADAILEYARAKDIVCLDLRPAFRASDRLLYWDKDRHINLAAHELIAAQLLPLIADAPR